METEQHIHRARLDFLYQSTGLYAVTVILYLLARSFIFEKVFPTVWQDPLLLLLLVITGLSIGALLYHLVLHRRIEIQKQALVFKSAVRERKIEKDQVAYIHFRRLHRGKGHAARVVKIGLKDRRLPVRIRPRYFEDSHQLIEELKSWAGPLGQEMTMRKRRRVGSAPLRKGRDR